MALTNNHKSLGYQRGYNTEKEEEKRSPKETSITAQ